MHRRLSAAELAALRTLKPFTWDAWPPDDYDQGLPVVEVRRDQLLALVDEVEERRRDGERHQPDDAPGIS